MSDWGTPPPPDDPWGRPPQFEAPHDSRFAPPSGWKRGHTLDIRPMTLSDIFDRAFNLYRLHWKTVMGLVAILVVPLNFLEAFLTRNFPVNSFGQPLSTHLSQTEANNAAIVAFVLGGISFFFVQPLILGGLSRAVAAFHTGRSPTVGEALEDALPFLMSVVLVLLLVTLVVLGGLILLIIPGIFFAIRFGFSVPVVVVEGQRGREAMRRSWRLSDGNFWRVFGIGLVAFLLAGFVSAIVVVPATIAAHNIGPSGWWIRAIGSSVGAVLTPPFPQTVITLLYLDLRARKEGVTPEGLELELDRSR